MIFLVLITSFTLGVNRINYRKIKELYLWKRVFQIRYQRQNLYETFGKGPRKKLF